MDMTSFGRPVYQTIEGKDYIFMNSSVPSQFKSGQKNFVGLKFFLLERNPFLFGLHNNEICELHIGPKKLRQVFEMFSVSPNATSAPLILVFRKDGKIYKRITIKNRIEKKMIIDEIYHLNNKRKT